MKALAYLICLFLVTVATAKEEEESKKTLYFVNINNDSDGSKLNYPNLKKLSLIKPNIINVTAAMLNQLKAAESVAFIWGSVNAAEMTPQFKEFSISECNLTSLTIDPTLDYQEDVLLLDQNKLTALPAHFNVLKKLQFFSIEHNQIESINAEDFNGFTKLKRMSLAYNNIVHISSSPERPTVLPAMTSLYLTSNQLRNVSFENWSGPSMTLLYLNENPLTIALSVFDVFPKINVLNVAKNPLNCGWLNYLKKHFKGKDHYLGDPARCTETGESMEELIERIKRE